VDGSTTISPIKSNSRQTPNISALGDSTDKGKNNVPTKQGEVDNITKEAENLTFSNKMLIPKGVVLMMARDLAYQMK
jgi:hypothetical protein